MAAVPAADREPACEPAGPGKAIVLCAAYIVVSPALIRFNKFLMQPDKFPHSMALALLHMTVTLVLNSALYIVRPSLFPGVQAAEGKRIELLKWFVPIGGFFAIALYTSNRAYIYCDVAFLQLMKESNVMICFLLSCLVGIQSMDRVKLFIVTWVVAASAYAVGEELDFVLFGFLLQVVSQLAESIRTVMGECVLTGAGLKLDPLSYTLFTAPVCLVVLLIGTAATWEPTIWTSFVHNWYLLVPNALLAVLLNWLVASIIKETSAVGYTMTGVLTDTFIVLVSAASFGEIITGKQVIGFFGSITGIVFWSILRAQPDSPLVARAYAAFGSHRRARDEESWIVAQVLPKYGTEPPLVTATTAAATDESKNA